MKKLIAMVFCLWFAWEFRTGFIFPPDAEPRPGTWKFYTESRTQSLGSCERWVEKNRIFSPSIHYVCLPAGMKPTEAVDF
jgi:hypothetical protein